jgi:hypothetical protein
VACVVLLPNGDTRLIYAPSLDEAEQRLGL